MTDETRFGARREETHANVVILAIGRQHERGVAIVEFAGDGEHFFVAEDFGAQYDAGRVAGEELAGEGIDLENLDGTRHVVRTPGASRGRDCTRPLQSCV